VCDAAARAGVPKGALMRRLHGEVRNGSLCMSRRVRISPLLNDEEQKKCSSESRRF
jgi:hypothetical protein